MADEKSVQERKREVAARLIYEAGTLIEFWTEKTEQTEITAEEARGYIASWLQYLPGKTWDTRLGQVPEKK